MAKNGTYRELERRAQAYKEATGRDLAGLWISLERFHLLPEAVRQERLKGKSGWMGPSPVLCHIAGVPVRVLEIVHPPGQ